MENGNLLAEIHEKVCRIDERTQQQADQIKETRQDVAHLRDRTARHGEAIDSLKLKKQSSIMGAGAGTLAAVLIEAAKQLLGWRT